MPNPAGLWDANKLYSFDKVPEISSAWHKIHTESIHKDFDIGGFSAYLYYQAYDMWWVTDRYIHTTHTSAETWPEIFAPFEKIESLPDTTRVSVVPYSNITVELATSSPYGLRNIYGTFTFRPSVELEEKLFVIFQEEVEVVKTIEEVLPVLVLQPFAARSMSHMSKNGGNALGLSEADGPLVILNIAWRWKHASDDAVNYGAYHKFMERGQKVAKEMGLLHRFLYANYADETQDVWAGYGDENLQRLRKIQRQVDPKGIFTKGGLAGSGYKLNVMAEDNVTTDRKRGGKSEL